MNFTKELPTRPGFYAWRRKTCGKIVVMRTFTMPCDDAPLCCAGEGTPLGSVTRGGIGGEWCLLVPAGEIEKAWKECLDGQKEFECDPSSEVSFREQRWNASRARRVMNGDEV